MKKFSTRTMPCFTDDSQARAVKPEEREQKILEMLIQNNYYELDYSQVWLSRVFAAYRQPHRYFHTLVHLQTICAAILETVSDKELRAKLLLTALFHDVVWYPEGGNSEELSVEAFLFVCSQYGLSLSNGVREEICRAIMATKTQVADSELASRFHDYDCQVIIHGNEIDLLAYEYQVFREFQCLNMQDYRKGRRAFFNRFARRFPECSSTMHFLVEYLERRRPRIGIYAGTFNPFHIGHLSILEKAEQMFDKVIVAVGINPQKDTKKDQELESVLPFHEVVYFDSLVVDLIEKESVLSDVILVRGLRNGYDLDYEMNQMSYINEMRPNTQAVYIPCDKKLEHISSSALNGFSRFNMNGRDKIYYPTKYFYYRQTIPELFGK
ncbi:MAG: adenylyltransferase/cytidyltransferase family protein [Lentisphaeria bacterium]